MLTTLHGFNERLLAVPAHRLYQHLHGPTLIHLAGDKDPALFLSVLLHGNETSGWDVVKRIIKKYHGKALPRSMSIFIGNVMAARYKKRKLRSQPDYNRVWSSGCTAEHEMMASIIAAMRERGVFASIDIHNNNGPNPHYACVNHLDRRLLTLARRFSRIVVYFIRPNGVQSLAFAEFCPAVTLECGQPDDEYGIELTTNYVDHVLNLDNLGRINNIEEQIDLYHTIGIVKIKDEFSLGFNGEATDIQFIQGIERLNFEEIPAHTIIGTTLPHIDKPFIVLDENGNNVLDDYFKVDDCKIQTNSSVIPAMLTDKVQIIRQDCFCYLMERYDISQGEKKLLCNEPAWR